ncbi:MULTISPECIES: hypothetical protein [Yaniella]
MVIIMTGFGALLIVIGAIAVLAMDPVSWFGVGIAWLAGVYSIVMARVIRRRASKQR